MALVLGAVMADDIGDGTANDKPAIGKACTMTTVTAAQGHVRLAAMVQRTEDAHRSSVTAEAESALPTTLTEAMEGIDWRRETTNGAQRIVFFADDYVVKYDPAEDSNINELAWFAEVPEQVARCQALEIDVDPETLEEYDLFGHWLVMERADDVGYGYSFEGYCCYECSGIDSPLDEVCQDDLHPGNVGTMPDGRLVAIDMGCCHPHDCSPGYFGTRSSSVEQTVHSIATIFGCTVDRPQHWHN